MSCNLCKRYASSAWALLSPPRHKPSSFWKKGGPGRYNTTIRQEFLLYGSYWVGRHLRTYLSCSTLVVSSNPFPKVRSHENTLETNTLEQTTDSIPVVWYLLLWSCWLQLEFRNLAKHFLCKRRLSRKSYTADCAQKELKFMSWLTYRIFIHPEIKHSNKMFVCLNNLHFVFVISYRTFLSLSFSAFWY